MKMIRNTNAVARAMGLLAAMALNGMAATPTKEIKLVNPSFEQPGSDQTDWANVPGWDGPSGSTHGVRDTGNAKDGSFQAHLPKSSSPVSQTTSYLGVEGDELMLAAYGRQYADGNSYLLFRFYYVDGASKV